MFKKLSLTIFIIALLSNLTYSQQIILNPQQKTYYKNAKSDALIVADENVTSDIIKKLESGVVQDNLNSAPPVKINSVPFSGTYSPEYIGFIATFTPIGGSSYYPLQSNATPLQIWQDPNNINNIHAVYTTCPTMDSPPSYPNRRTAYYFSSNKGVTWSYVIDSPAIRSGFGNITGTSDGNAMIVDHNGSSLVHCKVYVDVAPGVGAFTEIDPNNGAPNQRIWGRIIATQYTSFPIKYVMISSVNNTAFDSTFITKGTSLSSPTFQGSNYQPINSNSAEGYQIARGSDGRIGITYIAPDVVDLINANDVFFMESTDNGSTFSTPLKIFDSRAEVDSLGALRGLSICYLGTVPKVAFDIAGISGTSYFPGKPNKIGFWSPNVNSGNYVIMAKSGPGGNVFAGPRTSPFDVLTPIGRVSIGASMVGDILFAAFMAQDTIYRVNGTDTTSYSFIYITESQNGGATWHIPQRLTPRTTPAKDWSFPSISPTNDRYGVNFNEYIVNINCSQDDAPLSDALTTPDPLTNQRNTFVRVLIQNPIFVQNISSEVPASFSLKQNFPNPFNPTTKIRFDIPKLSNVTLKVYNIAGQEVATLVNNEVVSAGVKEVTFDATKLASGIYFYTLQAGDFKETKKMILMK